MSDNPVTIVKDGRLVIADEDQLCVDDVVIVQAGDLVPADIRLLEANNLAADEFNLTGEILPVTKKADDHETFLFMGSRITRGTGKGVVVATGEQTEFGNVLKQSWELSPPHHLLAFEKKFIRPILWLLPAFLILFFQGSNILVLMTGFLAASLLLLLLQNAQFFTDRLVAGEVRRIERKNIVIRNTEALRWMRSIDMICFDKTGVLTASYLSVQSIYMADKKSNVRHAGNIEQPSALISLGCALCNEVLFLEKFELANPIDKALIVFAQKNGIDFESTHDRYKRVFEQPFDSENRYMAVGFEDKDHEKIYFVKGDPAVIVKFCTHYLTSTGDVRKLDGSFLSINRKNIDAIQENGNSVIALAYSNHLSGAIPSALTFLCLIEMESPLQPGVRELIDATNGRRTRSILLTGDRAETAGRVAVEVGISRSPRMYMTGPMIQHMALNEVARQSEYCSIFARLLPSQKAVLIRIFQQKGHCVAMIGDGPNDGLALRTANIGISFIKDSSPIARRLSHFLINDLADILVLIDASNRLNLRIGNVQVFRLLVITLVFLAAYGAALTLYAR